MLACLELKVDGESICLDPIFIPKDLPLTFLPSVNAAVSFNLACLRVWADEVVGEYFADILVEDQVIIELKTVDQIKKIHEAQLLNYLKATGIKVGLLVNFYGEKADIKRLVLNLPEGHGEYQPATSAG